MSHILVTGGAGYIGSHACKTLKANGFTPIAVDNLSTGWADAVKFGPFEQVDLCDKAALLAVFETYKPKAVLHFAALSQIGEAVRNPGLYWRNNVLGSLNLFEACVETGCQKIVFSSTCATYGDQDQVVLTEQSDQKPINAYGASKLATEHMLRDFQNRYQLEHVIFRYFNVAGADPDCEIGEFHQPETHLIPLILDAISGAREDVTVFGTDYDTPDGTCIRDYVHVSDLVDAHISGLTWLLDGKGSEVFNLGTGSGFSVMDVINQSHVVTNKQVPHVIGARRDGDCAALVSGSDRARDKLGWSPDRSTLRQMIQDAWRWHQTGHYDR